MKIIIPILFLTSMPVMADPVDEVLGQKISACYSLEMLHEGLGKVKSVTFYNGSIQEYSKSERGRKISTIQFGPSTVFAGESETSHQSVKINKALTPSENIGTLNWYLITTEGVLYSRTEDPEFGDLPYDTDILIPNKKSAVWRTLKWADDKAVEVSQRELAPTKVMIAGKGIMCTPIEREIKYKSSGMREELRMLFSYNIGLVKLEVREYTKNSQINFHQVIKLQDYVNMSEKPSVTFSKKDDWLPEINRPKSKE